MLAARADALQHDDAPAYVATAIGSQRKRDQRDARRRHALPLTDFGYAVESTDLGTRHATVRVQSQYTLRGITGRFAGRRTIRAVLGARGWKVASERAVRERHPWEVEPYRSMRSPHFLVLAPTRIDVRAAGFAGDLEAAYARMRSRLAAASLRRRYLVVVAGDPGAARELTTSIRGVESLAAITDARVDDEGPAQRVKQVVSLRLVAVWPALAGLGPDERRRILTHELTHAVLTPRTSGRTPAWLTEGVALYVSGDRRVQDASQRLALGATTAGVRRALTLRGLSRPTAIAGLAGPAQTAAYAYASAAAFYVAQRFGERRLLALYDAFNDTAIPGVGGVAVTDAAVRHVLHESLPRLDHDLRTWLRPYCCGA
jgi:hypothetical protein